MIVIKPNLDKLHYDQGYFPTIPQAHGRWYASCPCEFELELTEPDVVKRIDELIEFDIFRLFESKHCYLQIDGKWGMTSYWFENKKQLMAAIHKALMV